MCHRLADLRRRRIPDMVDLQRRIRHILDTAEPQIIDGTRGGHLPTDIVIKAHENWWETLEVLKVLPEGAAVTDPNQVQAQRKKPQRKRQRQIPRLNAIRTTLSITNSLTCTRNRAMPTQSPVTRFNLNLWVPWLLHNFWWLQTGLYAPFIASRC